MSDPESPKYRVPAQTEKTLMADADSEALLSAADRAHEDESFLDQRFHPRPRNGWPLALGLIILLLGGGLGWYWWQTSHAKNAPNAPAAGAPQPKAVPVKLATVESVTVQETSEFVGSLEAPRGVVIKPEVEGRIAQILVRDGERVQQGQVLVRLDSDDPEATRMQAKANLDRAQAALAELEAGSRPEEIAQAQARVNQAESRLANAKAGASPEEVAQAPLKLQQTSRNRG